MLKLITMTFKDYDRIIERNNNLKDICIYWLQVQHATAEELEILGINIEALQNRTRRAVNELPNTY